MNWNLDTKGGMANAIAWTQQMLNMIKDGGVWAVPRAASTYKVNHKEKTLTRTGMKSDPAINRVLAEMGWTVKEKKK